MCMHPKTHCCLAVDLGASSGRVIAGLHDGTKLTLREFHRFDNGPVRRGDTLYWDFDQLLFQVVTGIGKAREALLKDDLTPRTLGVDTWGVDFGLIDASGQLITPPVHYRDERTNGMMQKVFAENLPQAEIFEETGIQFMQLNTIFQLAALQRTHPEQIKRARHILLMGDLFHYLLSGRIACEYTNATTTQLCNARMRNWSDKLIQALGLPRDLFPEIISPGTPLGPVDCRSDTLGRNSGLQLIAVATHDTGSAVAAVPATGASFAFISCGTWSLLGTETREPVITPESARLNFTNEGGVDGTYRVLKNIMGLWLLQETRSHWRNEGRAYTWDRMAELASEAEGFRSFINPDDARFLPPGDMPARVREYCSVTDQPVPDTDAAVVRCITESLALKYAWAMERLEQLTEKQFETVHMVGGGIQNQLLCQWTANATNRPVIAGPIEATAIGNLGMQLVASGRVDGLAGLRAMVRESFEPQAYSPTDTDAWQNARTRFTMLVE